MQEFWRSDEVTGSWLPLPKTRANDVSNQANEIIQIFTEYFSKRVVSLANGILHESVYENNSQKLFPRGIVIKKCSGNMQQLYRKTPMSKCAFNKVAAQDF